MSRKSELVEYWRSVGPVAWAEGPYGWTGVDGEPITLTPWQKAVLETWWAYRESVTTLAVSNIKKTGKTFTNAVLLCWRWLALPGEHFAVGNDFDQSAGRQFLQIKDMVRRNPFLRSNVKVTGKQLTFTPTGSTITALPVDAAGNAGSNHISSSHTETFGIVYESGIRAYEELVPPPGRFYGFPAMRICDSYAGYEGESETWHKLVDRGLAGERIDKDWPIYRAGGILLFHIGGLEAQERCFRGTPAEAATYYEDQRAQLRDNAYLRFHENQRVIGSETFIHMEWWDACTDPEHRPKLPFSERTRLYVGVDGAIKNDSAAVVALYKDRKANRVMLARHRIWQPTKRDPLDLDATIGEFLRELKKGYRIEKVLYDPYQLHDLSTRLKKEGIRMEEFPQSQGNLTAMSQNLFELIQAGNLLLYPDDAMRAQAARAVAVENPRGWRIAKEKSSHKIDAVVALAMAAYAAVTTKPRATLEDFKGLGHVDGPTRWSFPGDGNRPPPWRDGTMTLKGWE